LLFHTNRVFGGRARNIFSPPADTTTLPILAARLACLFAIIIIIVITITFIIPYTRVCAVYIVLAAAAVVAVVSVVAVTGGAISAAALAVPRARSTRRDPSPDRY